MEKLLSRMIYRNVMIWVVGSEEPFRGSLQDVDNGLAELSELRDTRHIVIAHITAVQEILS